MLHIKRNLELERIAQQARIEPGSDAVSADEYFFVRKYAASFREVAGDNPALLPLLSAYLRENQLPIEGPVLLTLKHLLLDEGLRPAAWRYVCRYGVDIFRPVWRMTRSSEHVHAAGLYLRALDAANLPPPPPAVIACAWLRMFSVPGEDRFRMDLSLESIPSAITGCVLLQADRWRYTSRGGTLMC